MVNGPTYRGDLKKQEVQGIERKEQTSDDPAFKFRPKYPQTKYAYN